MCGIFAWAGNNPKKFNKAKFDIQGIFNDERGGDSCGVTTDGEIYYGVDRGRKEYKDFLVESDYIAPLKIPTVFGHTRKSSQGIINSHNAHPFGFGDNNEGFRFIGCHNGTLHNHKEIARKYNVEDILYKTSEFNTQIYERTKIDSEILLEAVYKSNSYHPLEEYIGGAALLFTDTTEPNVLYAFHGSSRKDWDDDHKKAFEERPLYYFKESKNSLYVSSLSESLVAIGGVINETIFEFECNVVYKIKDGDIDKAETIKVNRNKAHQTANTGNNHFSHYPNHSMIPTRQISQCGNYNRNKITKKDKRKLKDLLNYQIDNIYDEKEERLFLSPIIFSNLRYRRNGHLLQGIYTWVPDYGITYLSSDYKNVYIDTNNLIDMPFDLKEGYFIQSKRNQALIDWASENIIIPFQTIKKTVPSVLYFYDGILLQTEADYIAVVSKFKNYTFDDLSFMSKHPIVNIKIGRKESSDQQIKKDGQLYSGSICPLGSKKIYDIEKGNLISIITREDNIIEELKKSNEQLLLPLNTMSCIKEQSDTTFIDNTIKEFIKEKEKEIVNFTPTEDEDPIIELEDDSKAIEMIDKTMSPIYLQVQFAELELRKFSKFECVKNVLEANNDYLITLDELVNDEG